MKVESERLNTRPDLRDRTKQFALRVMRLYRELPPTADAQVVGRQLLRSATSVAANYRAVQRARSKAEFVAKMGVVVEEADESQFWIEMLRDGAVLPAHRVQPLLNEATELVAIFVASVRTARR